MRTTFEPFFSNRECSFIIWGLILLIWMIYSKKLRNSLLDLYKSFLCPKLLSIYILGYLWGIIMILILNINHLWNLDLLKDTTIYILFSLSTLISKGTSLKNSKNLSTICFSNIKATSIIAFYINIYNYPFIVEFIGLPIVVYFVILQTYANHLKGKENKHVSTCLGIILSLISILYIINSLYWLVSNWNIIIEGNTILSLLLPIVLNIWAIPYVYALGIYCRYEEWFIKLYFRTDKNKKIYKFRKKQIIYRCGINLDKIIYMSKHFKIYTKLNKHDFIEKLNQVDRDYAFSINRK